MSGTAMGTNDRTARFLSLIFEEEGDTLDLTYSDTGNWTGGAIGKGVLKGSKAGISAASYPTLDIAGLTDDAIIFIYKQDYLSKVAFDLIPEPIAIISADCAINQGVGAAKILLQQSLGVTADGSIGPQTIAAANAAKDPNAIVVEYTARRALRYAQTTGIPTFGLGWFRRLARVSYVANSK